MSAPFLLEKYRALLESASVRETPLLLRVPRAHREIELQARWFNGDFGREFIGADGRKIEIAQSGVWNHEAGPDFIEAAVRVGGGSVRRGAIELDTDARDWDRHGHSTNPAYDGVVLHVFFTAPRGEYFTRTSRNEFVPQVRLPQEALDGDSPVGLAPARPGRCCGPLRELPSGEIAALLEGAARHRLMLKAARLERLARVHGPSEALFQSVAIALGYKENKLPFQLLAQRLPLARLRRDPDHCAALLFGVAGFLHAPDLGKYPPGSRALLRRLWDDWWPLRDEMARMMLPADAWKWRGLRPVNHPQRRLGALAVLASGWPAFQGLLKRGSAAEVKAFLTGLGDEFWSAHYTLDTPLGGQGRVALIGETRAVEILANVFYPWRSGEIDQWWDAYAKTRSPLGNRKAATAAERLFGGHSDKKKFLSLVAYQQGLLQIYEDFCLRDDSDCARCPFPEQLPRWIGG